MSDPLAFIFDLPARPLDPTMGEAVFARTYRRPGETWTKAAKRTAFGNVSLRHVDTNGVVDHDAVVADPEFWRLYRHVANGVVPLSGRHLQHGDERQAARPMEVFTNCSTAAMASLKFYLMLNGSGVGRSYEDRLMKVDWDNLPIVENVLGRVPSDHAGAHLTPGATHPEAQLAWAQGFLSREQALAHYDEHDVTVFEVPDTREGWAKAVELLEGLAFAGTHTNKVVLLDWSRVRPKGSPIGGMQDRPASGPLEPMEAIKKAASVKGRGWKPWKQTMYVDHYLAAAVHVGGARRAARIAVKPWWDADVLEFINLKNEDQADGGDGLWSSNNSVGVTQEFWDLVRAADAKFATPGVVLTRAEHRAWTIFEAANRAAYEHGTGEPGWLNLDKLAQDRTGLEAYRDGRFAGSTRYQLADATLPLSRALVDEVLAMDYYTIVNPCGEVPLNVLGGYCVIGNVAPFHAETLDEARDAFVATARALMRVNLMDSLYKRETLRTNRIGVGFTGLLEFAWKFFALAPRDLLNVASRHFWAWLGETRQRVEDELVVYAAELGVVVPHTAFMVAPTGTVSKLWNLTEGAHFPAMAEYLRNVQFQHGDPLLETYRGKGYPVVDVLTNAQGVVTYPNVAIVGFPTQPLLRTLGIPEAGYVTAPELTLTEQFTWVRLIEHYWLGDRQPGQTSYTAKYHRATTSYAEYRATVLEWMPGVRAISVMPADDWRVTQAKFGYVPEQPISRQDYEEYLDFIDQMAEVMTLDELQCASGACPI